MMDLARTAIITASLITGLIFACPANAAKPTVDYFSAGTAAKSEPGTRKVPSGGFPMDQRKSTPIVTWFEHIDDLMYSARATEAEKVLLSRPFNQEAERVQQWTETAVKVIKRFRGAAKTLRMTSVPDDKADIVEYRNLVADWYDDVATVYDDLIRPRKPAKTMEELDAALDDIKQRAGSLSQTNRNLMAMNMTLRKTYGVHQARHEDALHQYVNSR